MDIVHSSSIVLASFLASSVECVEALTIVLAVGVVRGWRSALAGAGTGGTISGAGRYLKEQNPKVQVIATDSVNSFRATKGNPKPYKIEGIGVDFVSPVLDYAVVDAFYEVHDDDALAMLKTLAHKHGLLVGPSSGAVACAVAQYAPQLNEGDIAVMICGDSGRAYLSKNLYV